MGDGQAALPPSPAKENPGAAQIVITTTDVHLPHRIGAAIHRTFQGTLDHHFDEVGYFIRVNWRRDS